MHKIRGVAGAARARDERAGNEQQEWPAGDPSGNHRPIAAEQLADLLQHLDAALLVACDHSLRFTAVFLGERELGSSALVPWLIEQGANCDCEAFAIIAERWSPPAVPIGKIRDHQETPPATRSRPPKPTTRQKTSRR